MGPSLGFVTGAFFLCGAVLHIMVCSMHHWIGICAIVVVYLHRWSCIAPLFLDTIWVSSDQERLYFYSSQNCQQETAGNEPAIGDYFSRYDLSFK